MNKLLQKNLVVIIVLDILLLTSAFFLSHLIRFEFRIPIAYLTMFWRMLPIVIGIKICCFSFFDLYKGMWRYTSLSDLLNIIKASTVSTLLIVSSMLFVNRFAGFSRAVFIIDWCMTILFVSGFRMAVRVYYEQNQNKFSLSSIARILSGMLKRHSNEKRLIIIGAGDCAVNIFREIRGNPALFYNIVGFLDDDPDKIGRKIHGIPVLGELSEIRSIVNRVHADEALIAIPSADSKQMRQIVSSCRESNIEFKIIPGYGELINGKVTVNAIREVAYRDLLGREVIELDTERIGKYIAGQTILITGAGGSIGSELCRQVCRFGPHCLLLFDRAESSLYDIDLELRQNWPEIDIRPILADVVQADQIGGVMREFKPNTVFHAAAYKHVPMLEIQPWKAIENNIQGTMNVAEAARAEGVERFVFVSTDKAVRPANVMGVSKRIAEMLILGMNCESECSTRFMTVRFGNVAGSVGSVIPLFKKQIERGGPVTVTHPDVTRFFMTIPEAAQLIIQAGAMGNGGEIFILNMGTAIKIADMARDLIRLSGFEPDDEIKVTYIGLRPGEKLYEELITEGEGIVPTGHNKIMVLKGEQYSVKQVKSWVEDLQQVAGGKNREEIRVALRSIVPEYSPQQ